MPKGQLSTEQRLTQNVARLKTTNLRLRTRIAEQQKAIETLKLQVAKLQTMVFGRKRKPPAGTPTSDPTQPTQKPRDKASYRRPLPPVIAITAEELVPLPDSCPCGDHSL